MSRLPVVWPPLTGDVHQSWPGKRWWQKPGPWCRTKARLGRRGAMQLLLGATYVLIGVGVVLRPPTPVRDAYHLMIPLDVRGALWVASGLIAGFFAFRSHSSDARWWRNDALGWLALYAMPVVRITSYGGSAFLWAVTDPARVPPLGDATAWYPALLHVPFVLIVLICSGWIENPRRACK